jgi:hypothetical protein
MVKCGVLFEVRTEFLNIIQTRFSFNHPYHHNVFTFTLFLPEGWAGVAWEPTNKMKLFLPPRKIKWLSLHPLISSLNLLFIYPSHLSLRLQTVKVTDSNIADCHTQGGESANLSEQLHLNGREKPGGYYA